MSLSNWDVLKEMGKRSLDIKMADLNNLRKVQVFSEKGPLKGWGCVEVAVDADSAQHLLNGDSLVFAVIIANGKQFQALKAEMESHEYSANPLSHQ